MMKPTQPVSGLSPGRTSNVSINNIPQNSENSQEKSVTDTESEEGGINEKAYETLERWKEERATDTEAQRLTEKKVWERMDRRREEMEEGKRPSVQEADKYYRVLASDSFDFDFYMDDESLTDAFTDEEAADSSLRYTAVVEFSSAEAWTFSCRVNKDNKLTAVFSEPMEGYDPMMHISRDTLEKAADHVREYLKTRYAEVTSSPLFKETVGDSFLVVQINPQVTNTFLVYEGQNPECKGLYLVVKTDDGKEYAAVIDVEYDEKTDTEKERKLYILEQP